MATVKILYNDTADNLEDYLTRKSGKDVPQMEHSCFIDGLKTEFAQVQSSFNSKGNSALHIIQSWSPAESQLLTPDKVHELGVEMATQFAPGHQFVVQTHTDQAHYHNHIVVNPVSMETGKRIQNKYENLYKLRDLNDAIAKEHGLSVLPRQERLRSAGLNEKSRRIEAYRGRSYIVDLANKAHFARGHATNYDEYVSILSGFNIQTRIENQNITYFYPGREVGKRGRNLDPSLDKPGLEKKFAENLEKLDRSVERSSALSKLISSPGILAAEQSFKRTQNPINDLVSNRVEGITQPRESVLQQSVIPVEEIQKAKTESILRYCEREKIKTQQTPDGHTVLQGRDYVELREYSWLNHKNQTQGTVIDFVANHRSTSLLHAVSIINQNPNLMLLETQLGEVKRHYQSFNIPKEDSASRPEALRQIAIFLNRKDYRKDCTDYKAQSNDYAAIFKSQAIQVTYDHRIRFFTERDQTGFLEYLPDQQGGYQKQKHGEIRTAFFMQKGKGAGLAIYLEPRSFLKHQPNAFKKDRSKDEGVLALLEPNLAIAHHAIATQKNVKRVRVIQNAGERLAPESSKFFEELKTSLDPFSIDTSLAWEVIPSDLSQQLPGHGREQNIDFLNF